MAASSQQSPFIIKLIRRPAEEPHSATWKVAYADLMTAMMAFFLLLWLYSVATPKQKAGISEYFTPTMGISGFLGTGSMGGNMPAITPGNRKDNMSMPALVLGEIRQGPSDAAPDVAQAALPDPNGNATASHKHKGEQDEQELADRGNEAYRLEATADSVRQALEPDQELKDFRDNVIVQELPEGIKIDLVDDPTKPLFFADSANLTDAGRKLLNTLATIILNSDNMVAISGHMDAGADNAWDLSADRANAVRRELMVARLEPRRIAQILGMGERDPLLAKDPRNPRNRRVTITLMRNVYFRSAPGDTTRGLLTGPDIKTHN